MRLEAETLRSVPFGSIGASYTAIGTPFLKPIIIVKLQNLTDQTLLVSWYGTDDTLILLPNAFDLFDVRTNRGIEEELFIFKGDLWYVKHNGTPPTTGAFYLSAFYDAS